MSEINVDRIADSTGLGAPEFPYGAILNSVGVITATNVSVANSVTAAEYYGDGSKLTGVASGDATYAAVAGIATVAEGLTGFPSINVIDVNASGQISADSTQLTTNLSIGDYTTVGGGVSAVNNSLVLRSDSATALSDGIMIYRGGNTASDRVGGFLANGKLITVEAEINGDLTIDGDVSIGGTIAYEDVTNVNSVGVITANSGIDIRSNTLTDTTVFRYEYQYVDDDGNPRNESVSFDRVQTGALNSSNSPNTSLVTAGAVLNSTVAAAQNLSGNPSITVTNVNATGTVTATSFAGALATSYTLGANGTSDYTFTGPGLTGAENDPAIYLVRGQTYNFVNNMGAHPFRIQSDPNGSAGTAYNDGITNNDVSNGTLEWDVQFDAPDVLYYQCTAHPNMGGIIYIGTESRGLENIANTGRTLIKGDVGALINTTSGGTVTVPSGVFELGDLITVYNNSSSTMSISASGTTLRKAGTSNTGTCTVDQYGTASILCVASNEFVVSGNIS